jgi:hypothetical protein
METATATLELDRITVVFSADMERSDYGVQGSPVWYEPTNIEVVSVEILDVEVTFKLLPPGLQKAIRDLADEIEDWS